MKQPDHNRFWEPALVVVGPLSLAVLELFHPHPHDLFALDLQAWLIVHYLQIPLFPLAALAVVVLVCGHTGFSAALCRVAMFVSAVAFVAFDTAAGVVTGILLEAAHASGVPDAWRAPVMTLWTHPIMGAGRSGVAVLAVFSTTVWLVGCVAAAVTVRRAGGAWVPASLLVVAALGMCVFRTHAWPGGPIAFGALAAAGAWLQWVEIRGSRRSADDEGRTASERSQTNEVVP